MTYGSEGIPSHQTEQDARSVWFIWLVWLVWFNQINKTNQTNQMNQTGWRTVSASFQDYALGTIRVR